MKKSRNRCEELSELLDRTCSEDQDDQIFSQLSPEDKREMCQLQESLVYIRRLRGVTIENGEDFLLATVDKCKQAGKVVHINKKRYYISGAVAALFVAAVTFSYNNSNSYKVHSIKAEIVSESKDSFSIESLYEKDINKLKEIALGYSGQILKVEDEYILVKATISDYMMMKKELTLSAEEKVFLKSNRALQAAGTNGGVISAKYIEEVITFKILRTK